MRTLILATIAAAALCAPACADTYPVSGKWGQSATSEKGPVDCTGKRVIAFNDNQRTDSKGGVPAYRNVSVTAAGSSQYRVTDEFVTGQIRARAVYMLRLIDPDHIELNLQPGGIIKLRRCK